ncbi:MAG: ATP synthase F1 subunit epsilon [Armatimonadetes bacterium]|nr:ATP synthase F1 subunit epsilon [Armatimonadota bacterium]MCX7967631.1 ATP synthase F1 subunit epsilon [Armatimonadota bacterium]MDW8142872.1 ATP synthase F1 subunit epsilon [Armatimonadota bacterium]
MARTFSVEILTPERVLFSSDQVISLTVPAWEGSLGIMASHAPMVAALRIGVITIRLADGDDVRVSTAGGFIEVADNKAIILCDVAELDEEIDVERAQRALQRALERLRNFQDPTIDRERARKAKERAMARLKAAGVI